MPGVVLSLLLAQAAPAARHRFLWIGMSATAFWVVVAAVVAGIGVGVAALVRTRRRRPNSG